MARRDSAGLNRREGRRFGLVVGSAFGLLAAVGWWRGHHLLMYVGLVPSVLLLLGAALLPVHLRPVQRAWMAMAEALSRVTNPVVLGLVYLLVITPIGLLMRLLGKNPIRRSPRDGSYWVQRDEGAREDLHRQF